jgi:hypothetical protein
MVKEMMKFLLGMKPLLMPKKWIDKMGFEVKYGKRSRRGARNQLSILGATAE